MQKVTEILFFIFTSRKKRYIRGDRETGHKKNSDIFSDFLLSSFNDAIDKSYFPKALKQVNITPVFNAGERYSKDNYRPINILPNVSNIFEKFIFRQMFHCMGNFLSKHQSSFRK